MSNLATLAIIAGVALVVRMVARDAYQAGYRDAERHHDIGRSLRRIVAERASQRHLWN